MGWENGNWAEAHSAWRQADDALRKFKAIDENENKMIMDLHIAVLKNFAQACIKLEYWTDALEAADAAIKIDPDDYKAWYRKSCALEGLGRIQEAEDCCQKIDECMVGRADRVRITKDTQARREKLQSIRERDAATNQRMLGKALEKGVFSGERCEQKPVLEDQPGDTTKKKLEFTFDERTR